MSPRRFMLLASLPLLIASAAASAGDITIYRCTGGDGKLTLRDSPCHKGETQQAKEMQRPKDPPKRAKAKATTTRAPSKAVATVTAAASAPVATTRYIVMTPPKPMYECTTPDGTNYMSETGEGNPRWMPLWALGYPVVDSRTSLGDNIGGRPTGPSGSQPGPPMGGQFVYDPYGPGSWVRDTCTQLPQQEVCARLRDRRWDLGRSYNSALQGERQAIDREQRGIDARLANDCGGV
ncbi:DUF4124 domain-containing protein [Lysobacter sp. S4-A87]|nr:DUF4124 domain-containing protein [Lysobacter sp. S4-A87]UNK51171.1 DUF4124 domain-containing protein [Lysobacter sp. S4-A87]